MNRRHNSLMKRNRTMRTKKLSTPANVDRWSIRAVILLQGIVVILGILAGTTLEQSSQIAQAFLKLLEIVTRVS